VVAGLSMGGGLAIYLAAKHPERLQGVVAINSYIHDPRLAFAPIGRLFMKTRPGVVNDIKKPGQDEVGYPRVPLAALPSLAKLLKTVVADLPSVTAPLLVFSSLEDHVAKPANSALVMQRAGSAQKDMVRLANSYHVATLDYDAEEIFQRTLDFAKATART